MKFYVVRHVDGKYSVQDNPQGGGVLIGVEFDPWSIVQARLVCETANKMIELMETRKTS